MSDQFDTDPFFRGPKVAANVEEIRDIDMVLAQPLEQAQHDPDPTTDENLRQQACDAVLELAERLGADIDVLQMDLSWIKTLPPNYNPNPDITWILQTCTCPPEPKLSGQEQTYAKAWIDINGGIAQLVALVNSVDFEKAREDLSSYTDSVRAARADGGPLGQSLPLASGRLRAALSVLEAGVLANQSDMVIRGVRAYESYLDSGGNI